jgi:hypothetical protein
MKLRYFLVDASGQLQRVAAAALAELWEGRCQAEELGGPARNEIRLVSLVCDKNLIPKKVYLLRLPLSDGRFTQENYLTLQIFSRSDCVTPNEVIQHHTEGWPPNFFLQLAVAMDVPLESVNVPLGVGGPLFVAAAMRVTLHEAVRYLR